MHSRWHRTPHIKIMIIIINILVNFICYSKALNPCPIKGLGCLSPRERFGTDYLLHAAIFKAFPFVTIPEEAIYPIQVNNVALLRHF